uniref:Tetratricopeptide repeat protein 1 n=1 Tax=Calcidiscus leptoporus TaxID=127549 RepID=A0A7S0J1B8_9EUKA
MDGSTETASSSETASSLVGDDLRSAARDDSSVPAAEGDPEQCGSGGGTSSEGVDPQQQLELARTAKEQGNLHFGKGEWDDAIECYSEAIEVAPADSPERAVFFANRAACYSKIHEYEAVIEDCTSALAIKPEYVKALVRRAQAREELDQPTEALEDMRTAGKLDPDAKAATSAIPRLEAASNAKLEKQKDEMLGKLKDLGNSVLGRFGMSLDNFKAEKDPSTGSYNISFQQ